MAEVVVTVDCADPHRAVGLGATVVDAGFDEELGSRWQVMADPEGDEVCIVEA